MQDSPTVPTLVRPRVHVSLEVADLEASIAFYTLLLGVEPGKRRADYARFEPTEPPMNLSLLSTSHPPGPFGASHFGIQVPTAGEVQRRAEALRAGGLTPRIEARTTCCHALQDKAWVTDPDGRPWEVFHVLDDAPGRDEATSFSTCCDAGRPT